MDIEREDACIETLRSLAARGVGDPELHDATRGMTRGYRPVVRQACWLYTASLAGARRSARSIAAFARRHRASWDEYLFACARADTARVVLPDHCRGTRHLFVGWHFPEYPTWLNCVARTGTLLLVARDVRWIRELAGDEHVCNFRSAEGTRRVARAFRDGRNVFAMLDHCYRETDAAVDSTFLGLPARTPAGVLRLAQRFDYDLQVLAPRDSGIGLVDAFPGAGLPLGACADRVNGAIEREIRADPPRWLLWAMLHERWVDERSAPLAEPPLTPASARAHP